MSDATTAKIAAKGCSATGITEELAIKMHDQLGKKIMAVVELESAARTEDSDGNQKVQLRILSVEPATESIAEDHLREFQRALYYNRQLDGAQPTLDGDGPEPTVREVLGRGESLLDHDDDGNPILWDGKGDELEDQGDDEDEGPSRDRPHRYIDTAHATCGHADCGLPAGAEIHTILGPVPA